MEQDYLGCDDGSGLWYFGNWELACYFYAFSSLDTYSLQLLLEFNN